MLLLHNNSLGDIIDTEKEKTKQEKKKKPRRFLHDLEQLTYPVYGFYCVGSRILQKKPVFFFLVCYC